MIVSHRLLRYCTPALHLVALAAQRRAGGAGAGPLYVVTLALQLALLAAAALGGLLRCAPLLVARYYVLTTASPPPACGTGCATARAPRWEAAEGTR